MNGTQVITSSIYFLPILIRLYIQSAIPKSLVFIFETRDARMKAII